MPLDLQRWERMAHVAGLYYEKGLTQEEIARMLGVSRPSVSRLLKEAQAEKVVEIHIHYPLRRVIPLERKLATRFGLRDARVAAPDPTDQHSALSTLAALTARYLEEQLVDGSVIALCSGTTTSAVIDAMSLGVEAHITVVQLIGSMGKVDQRIDGAELARRLSIRVGGDYITVPAPMVVENPETAKALLQERDIKHALDIARRADMALIGIGTLSPEFSHLIQAGYVSREQLAELRACGAVGDAIGRFFDIHGNLVSTRFDGGVIGLTPDELRAIPLVIAAAHGVAKGEAILGALRAGFINVLCTDKAAAEEVLKLDHETS